MELRIVLVMSMDVEVRVGVLCALESRSLEVFKMVEERSRIQVAPRAKIIFPLGFESR